MKILIKRSVRNAIFFNIIHLKCWWNLYEIHSDVCSGEASQFFIGGQI